MASGKIALNHKGWMIVADGSKALFLRNTGNRLNPKLEVFRVEESENPPDREQASDRPGRMADAGAGHKSAVENTDLHELAEIQFATDLAATLNRCAQQGDIPELALVASPATLGTVRKLLHSDVSKLIVGEVGKDLTNHPVNEIERIILS